MVFIVNRFIVDDESTFLKDAHAALAALAARPGYRGGRLGRAFDDPRHWCLSTEWESVGSYRRALGDFAVKLHATPLLALSIDEPSAYEELILALPDQPLAARASDRAADADPADRSRLRSPS